jgi:hypothetical protein
MAGTISDGYVVNAIYEKYDLDYGTFDEQGQSISSFSLKNLFFPSNNSTTILTTGFKTISHYSNYQKRFHPLIEVKPFTFTIFQKKFDRFGGNNQIIK